jgi:hypothetical protein
MIWKREVLAPRWNVPGWVDQSCLKPQKVGPEPRKRDGNEIGDKKKTDENLIVPL